VCDRNAFCTGTTPAQTVQKLVPFAMKRSGKKIYIIAADYNYGQITSKWMKKYCRDNGGTVVGTEFFPLDASNFGSTINKIQAAKPDLILSALVGGNHVAFYRQWAAAGMKAQIPIASTTFGLYNEPQILDQAENEGVMGAYGYFEELQSPTNKVFVDKVHAKFKDVPYLNEGACAAYEAILLWSEGVKKAGSIDRMKVIEALESGVGVAGPSGQATIDPATHHVVRSAYLAVVKSKKWSVEESYPGQKPLDTAAVCNLVKNPNENKQYVIEL
jgi:branched-chain amino acid transport system substrate-binding protein